MGAGALGRRGLHEHAWSRGAGDGLRRLLADQLVLLRPRCADGLRATAEDERMAGFIHIGTSTGASADRERPALAEIASRYGA